MQSYWHYSLQETNAVGNAMPCIVGMAFVRKASKAVSMATSARSTLWILWVLGVLGILSVHGDSAEAVELANDRSSETMVGEIPDNEMNALRALYVSAQGSQWNWTGTPWNFSEVNPDPCAEHWQGISCATVCDGECEVHVVGLTLSKVGMAGSLPDGLDGLSKLENLTISNNPQLGKTIPLSIGNLSHLHLLELSLNALTGPIPLSVGELSELRLLHLSSNMLTGTVPSVIGSLSRLHSLELSNNHLRGSLPLSMQGMTELQRLLVNGNALVGSFPTMLCELPNLLVLDLSFNQLTHRIPREIGQFRVLESLNMDTNRFNGTLPTEIGELAHITFLSLNMNQFTGALPASLGQLRTLEQLSVTMNLLNGSIPEELGGAVRLQSLTLSSNHLSGSLPSSLGNLTSLRSLNVALNRLGGAIPPEIGNLKSLYVFSVQNNEMGGTMPKELGQLTMLGYFLASANDFQGSVPSFIANAPSLMEIILSDNSFVGSIPSGWISTLPSLSKIDLSGNLITGNLPTDLALGTSLTQFLANDNHLEGTLLDDWAHLEQLVVLQIDHNQLRGTIPSSLQQLRSLQEFDCFSNLLTGPVPPSLSTLANLQVVLLANNVLTGAVTFLPAGVKFVNISANYFTGTIASLAAHPSASFIDMSYNSLTGSLPALGSSNMQMLFLQGNQFSGSMTSYFASQPADDLVNFDVSSNRLTGALPEVFASLGLLQSFMAMENCFTGTLPLSLCEITTLETLGLDGLSTSRNCHTEAWPGVLSSYYLSGRAVHGALPECLLTMPHMQVLHLSGNALSGTVSVRGGVVGANLKDLAVSHNRLSGSIPEALQGGIKWTNLDLSFNKFSGRLLQSTAAYSRSAEVQLDQNRLSGDIPQSYFDLTSLSILRANMFRCDGEGVALVLPKGDSFKEEYSCGSDSLNEAFITWCVLAMLIATIVLALLGWPWVRAQCVGRKEREGRDCGHGVSAVEFALLPQGVEPSQSQYDLAFASFISLIWRWWKASPDEPLLCALAQPTGESNAGRLKEEGLAAESWLRSMVDAAVFMQHLRGFAYKVTVFLVIIALPVYIGLSLSFGSYEDQFAWTGSAVYLSGTASAVALILLFVATALLLIALRKGEVEALQRAHDLANAQQETTEEPLQEPRQEEEQPQEDCVLGVSTHSTDSVRPSPATSFAAGHYGRVAALVLVNLVVVLSANAAFVATYSSLDRVQALVVALALTLFKIAWGVVLRQGVVRYLQPTEALDALRMENVRFLSTLVLFNNIVAPCLATLLANSSCFYYIFAQPPLISSSYMIMKCVGFDVGCVSWAAVSQVASFEPPFTYGYQCSSALLVDYAYVFAYKYALLGLVYPALVLLTTWRLHRHGGAGLGWIERALMLGLPPLWKADLLQHLNAAEPDYSHSSHIVDVRSTGGEWAWLSAMEREAMHLVLFSSCDYAVRMVLMVGTLLTFGVVLPALGVLVCVAICTNTALTQVGLARLVELSVPGCGRLEEVCRQCAQLMAAVQQAAKPVAGLVVMFYAVFVFDTEGDTSGAARGALLALPVVVVPVAMASGLRVWRRRGRIGGSV